MSTLARCEKKSMKERKAATLKDLRGKNDYEQKHIDYAKKVLDTVREYREKSAAPETAEAQAQMSQRRDLQAIAEQRTLQEEIKKIRKDQEEKGNQIEM